MAEIPLTNGELLQHRRSLRHARTTNGLIAVKLTKIRDALDAEGKSIVAGVDTIQQKYALIGPDGAAVVMLQDGKPLRWVATDTPVYERAEGYDVEAFANELREFDASPVKVTVPLLTAQDLGWITCCNEESVDLGPALMRFSEGI